MGGVTSWQLRVSGHQWLVKESPGAPGRYECNRLTGPNPGYGFTTQTSDRAPLSAAHLEEANTEFMADINPETGYLD